MTSVMSLDPLYAAICDRIRCESGALCTLRLLAARSVK
jgi:hypothetical protein